MKRSLANRKSAVAGASFPTMNGSIFAINPDGTVTTLINLAAARSESQVEPCNHRSLALAERMVIGLGVKCDGCDKTFRYMFHKGIGGWEEAL